jgi:flagellar protein FlaG
MAIQTLGGMGGAPATTPDAAPSVPSAPAATPAPTPRPAQAPSQKGAPTAAQLEEAVKQVQSMMSANAVALEFSVDHATGSTVTKVVDTQTNKVVLQIPSEETLAIAQAISEWQGMRQGLLVKQKA